MFHQNGVVNRNTGHDAVHDQQRAMILERREIRGLAS
jgi:hypothetical protein